MGFFSNFFTNGEQTADKTDTDVNPVPDIYQTPDFVSSSWYDVYKKYWGGVYDVLLGNPIGSTNSDATTVELEESVSFGWLGILIVVAGGVYLLRKWG